MTGAGDVDEQAMGWREVFGPRYLLPTTALGLSTVLHAVNFFVFASLAPSVIADLGELERLHWATTLYVVASIVSSAAAGLVRARFGARRALFAAVIAFAVGAAGVGAAPSMTMVLAARTLQGFGSGLLLAGAHGMIRDLFPAASWARMFAIISAVWGIAALAGPLIGGIFAALGEWRWGFLAMLPFCLILFLAVARTVPVGTAGGATGGMAPVLRLTLIGGAALAIGAAGGRDTAVTIAMVALAAALLLVAILWERRSAEPLFPHGMFRPSTVLGGGVGFVFFMSFGSSVTAIYAPYFLTRLHGVPALATGYVVTAQSMAWTVSALLVAGFVGARANLASASGPVVSFMGCLGAALFIPTGPLPAAIAAIVLFGFGIGMTWSHAAKRIFEDAGEAGRDRVTSVVPTTQALGVAFGSSVAGIVADRAGLGGTPPPEVVAEAARQVYLVLLPALVLAFAGAVRNAYGPSWLAARAPQDESR